ncbi:MAG TPA: choice-of-anchor X domain-containing protein [Candidatus Eisenbacteria bacterium]|nr:choice-of-anchor X domain-containing protein [Candidatus Eisenbacteria bacterium]
MSIRTFPSFNQAIASKNCVGFLLLLSALQVLAQAPPVGSPGLKPAAITVNTPTTITVTSRIVTPNVIPGSVNVQLLNSQGKVQSTLGLLHDDGVAPDLVAGDGVYSGSIVLNEAQLQPVSIRISAAVKGALRRIFSVPVSIDVLPPGIPTLPEAPDISQVTTDPATGNQIIGNEVLVCFLASTSIATIVSDADLIGGSIVGRFSGLGSCYQFGLPVGSTGATVDAAIAVLKARSEVVSAEADSVITTSAGPCYTCGTSAFLALRLDSAQTISLGAGTMVAILDTGIAPAYVLANHRIIPGPDELLGGIVSADYNGHGTFVAGVVSATAPDANIYVERVS